jgi:hypothetical protein
VVNINLMGVLEIQIVVALFYLFDADLPGIFTLNPVGPPGFFCIELGDGQRLGP